MESDSPSEKSECETNQYMNCENKAKTPKKIEKADQKEEKKDSDKKKDRKIEKEENANSEDEGIVSEVDKDSLKKIKKQGEKMDMT